VIEGTKKTNRNVLKITENYMELTKKGEVNVHMVFEKNKKNVTYYYTPYGSLLMGIDAYRVEVLEKEDELRVEVEYALELNNEHLANCRIRIKAVPRRESEFKLVEH
jgi:uncharacterized beta-barrel protein YwiB (DUF1934 family)